MTDEFQHTLQTPDRYRRLHSLGRGTWGQVSAVLDQDLRRLVALKSFQPVGGAAHAWAARAFEREVRILSYLDHPAIPSVFDLVRRPDGGDDRVGFTMRLVSGVTLGAHVGLDDRRMRCEPCSVPEAVRVLRRLGEALAHAHDRGILHLDLKPENVMVGAYGEVLLLDWGNARLFDQGPYRRLLGEHARDEDIDVLAREPEHRISGTALYMSPEQVDGDRTSLRPTSDVFSAGALLYLMLVGRPPFLGRSLPETLLAIQSQELPPLERLRHGIPPRLAEIVARMLAKDPAERYPDFHALERDLADLQAAGQGFELRELAPGEVLFREGEPGDTAYAILAGRVRVTRGPRHLNDLAAGQVVGELAVLTQRPRSATVTALEPTTLRVLPRDRVEREVSKLEPWMGEMVAVLARRFLDLLRAGDHEGDPLVGG